MVRTQHSDATHSSAPMKLTTTSPAGNVMPCSSRAMPGLESFMPGQPAVAMRENNPAYPNSRPP